MTDRKKQIEIAQEQLRVAGKRCKVNMAEIISLSANLSYNHNEMIKQTTVTVEQIKNYDWSVVTGKRNK